ncbi:Bud-site selection protein [Mrakia frigida]|uniref:BUD22 family protein n=1 Tax=Mrakia frigida TaxID=29902 RepID=UPI003FCBF660
MDPQPTDPVPEDSWAYSSKRKREAPQAPNPYIPFTQEQLEKKFHHLQKTLVAGAKKAQTFETQRLIKKIAQLKKKNDDSSSPEILDLSTQLTELKTVPLAPLTLLSLHTRLTKQKTLTTHPILALVVLAPPPPHDELKSKPANRILSSKTFAKEITDAVKTVRLWMDPEEREKEKEKVKEEKRVERRGPTVERNVLGGPPRGLASASTSTATAPRVQEENAEDEQEPLDERGNEDLYFEPGDGASSSGSDNENDEDEGNSSDDDGASQASWSSGSISSSTAAAPPAKKSKPPPAPTDPKAKKKKISTSTFLPSLSSGFIAGSDSEPEDLSDEGGERKNRRGQRARKA